MARLVTRIVDVLIDRAWLRRMRREEVLARRSALHTERRLRGNWLGAELRKGRGDAPH